MRVVKTLPEITKNDKGLFNTLKRILPENSIKIKLIDRISYATDAGFYHLIPKAVVMPANEAEIKALFNLSAKNKLPIVFRAAGTSLSGQAITDGILVDISRYWRKIVTENNGMQVRVQPGAIGSHVNHALLPFQRKIGPDPASINAAMMGGILSNNASGMCCGVKSNSYHTLKHLRFMLASGHVFSTENPEDYGRFEREAEKLASVLLDMRNKILNNSDLWNTVRSKYQLKNTVGYSINALIDFERPLDIFAHLLVGAEGTLGFLSEAVLNTVPDYPLKATGLLFFEDIFQACAAVNEFAAAGAQAIELMDSASLSSVAHMPGISGIIQQLPEKAAALLIEFQSANPHDLESCLIAAKNCIEKCSLLEKAVFTRDPHLQSLYWKVRKGLFPSVGAVRQRGTTVILEDVAVPLNQLGNAISHLQTLFSKYSYHNAIIFGHAKEGNIHFVITQSFDEANDIKRYDRFIREVVDCIVGQYNGSLKAEHGTGRNMAPFVVTEWGSDLYEIMQTIKKAADPNNLLNPGVIINQNDQAHIQNLKKMPEVETEVDACIECGFCEHKCPSRDLTMTPRRRIVARRALQQFNSQGSKKQHKELLKQYQYEGMDTCAVDGLCATACPVDIDTGKLVKRLRKEKHGQLSILIANSIARNFGIAAVFVRWALKLGDFLNRFFGKNAMRNLTRIIRKLAPAFPLWSNQLSAAPTKTQWKIKEKQSSVNSIVYFPSCINRVMGEKDGGPSVVQHFTSVADKLGIDLYIPPGIGNICCGQIFSSKGFADAYAYKANQFVEHLWDWSQDGKRPIVIDFSSCVYTAIQSAYVLSPANKKKLNRIRILETIQFLQEYVIPLSGNIHKKKSIAIHPVCSLEKLGINNMLKEVANHFAETVFISNKAGCCGMAGDRGFLFPELTQSACHEQASETKQQHVEGFYSTSKTCELAMSEAVGQDFHSIIRLVDECVD